MEPTRIEPTFNSMSALDTQIDGDHYVNTIQPIEFITLNELSFIQGNLIKYATRAPHKGSFRKDLEKIKHYCELWLELEGDKY